MVLKEEVQESKSHPRVDLPKEVDYQKAAQQVIALERRGLVLVGVQLERHLVDMFV